MVGPHIAIYRLITSTGNIRVLDGLKELEVRKGGLVAAEEWLTAEMLNNGPQTFNGGALGSFKIITTDARSHDFIDNHIVNNGKHLVGPSFFLRSAAEEFWLILSGNVLLNSKGLGDRIFAINNVRKVSEGDLAGLFELTPLLSTKDVALLLVVDAAVVEEVTSGITSGTTTEVPVAKDDLTFFIWSVTTTPRYRRTTAHRFE